MLHGAIRKLLYPTPGIFLFANGPSIDARLMTAPRTYRLPCINGGLVDLRQVMKGRPHRIKIGMLNNTGQ
ncbi:hypothetical protein BHU62_08475 [Serratia marcescens]|uniref:Uncharacterized protein n=1 Tax=Serratia marcescens TaxID=615 RepID=A0A1Q4P1S4_SERMA|nr:hypothetical protein BHU62_08475 [Serratia marcescens]